MWERVKNEDWIEGHVQYNYRVDLKQRTFHLVCFTFCKGFIFVLNTEKEANWIGKREN